MHVDDAPRGNERVCDALCLCFFLFVCFLFFSVVLFAADWRTALPRLTSTAVATFLVMATPIEDANLGAADAVAALALSAQQNGGNGAQHLVQGSASPATIKAKLISKGQRRGRDGRARVQRGWLGTQRAVACCVCGIAASAPQRGGGDWSSVRASDAPAARCALFSAASSSCRASNHQADEEVHGGWKAVLLVRVFPAQGRLGTARRTARNERRQQRRRRGVALTALSAPMCARSSPCRRARV